MIALWMFSVGLGAWVAWGMYRLITGGGIDPSEIRGLSALFVVLGVLGILGGVVGEFTSPVALRPSPNGVDFAYRFGRSYHVAWEHVRDARIRSRRRAKASRPSAILEMEIAGSLRGIRRVEVSPDLAREAIESWNRFHGR